MSRMRDMSKVQKRREYVKKAVSKSHLPTHKVVVKLAERFFLSIDTIYKDLAS